MTYTYVKLGLSPEAYTEIRTKLEAAGYQDQFHEDGAIDMHGIAVVIEMPVRSADTISTIGVATCVSQRK